VQGVTVDPNTFQGPFRVCASLWVTVVMAVAESSASSLVDVVCECEQLKQSRPTTSHLCYALDFILFTKFYPIS
jgi:hypothetical protein